MQRSSRVGRNDPCPCGSGKKYKRCCLAPAEVAPQQWTGDDLWHRVRATEGRLVDQIIRWLVERHGRELMEEAWDRFVFGAAEDEDPQDDPECHGLFFPWLVFTWTPPATVRAIMRAPSQPAALEFLAARRARLDALERRFIETACARPYSFHQVLEAEPGASLLLRDLLTGEEWRVSEKTASGQIARGTIFFTRVVPIDDVAICLGNGTYQIPARYSGRILDLRRGLTGKDDPIPAGELRALDEAVRQAYFDLVEDLFDPRPPQLRNTDGDPFELIQIRYELRCSVDEAFAALASLAAGHAREDLLEGAERGPGGVMQKIELPWLKKGNKLQKHWQNTVLGQVAIGVGTLVIDVNSRKRASRIKQQVKRRLEHGAVLLEERIRPPEALMAEAARMPEAEVQRQREESERLAQDPEVREFMERIRREHWQAWLDDEIPALGGLTPRQAARDARGRERLEALLLDFESDSTAGENPMAPDVTALRRELGLLE